jgi:hypothetical protein
MITGYDELGHNGHLPTRQRDNMEIDLISEYAPRMAELLPQAKRAYGSRNQTSPEHEASREYTRLLVEFSERGGNLSALAKNLGVAYAGVRRRVIMQKTDLSTVRPLTRAPREDIPAAASRVSEAKELSVNEYHDQLLAEYRRGISLAGLAKVLGLSSAAPLYYGVQRAIQRENEAKVEVAV